MTCPACKNPTETLIAGVCPRCKESFKAAHKRIDVKWSAEDFHYSKPRHVEAVTDADDHLEAEPELIELSQQEASEFDPRHKDLLRRMKVGFSVCMEYSGSKHLAMHCFALAMGFSDVIGVESDAKLADRFHVTKFTVTKCKHLFQEKMGLPPTDGQRSDEARNNMRKARINQLKP